MQTEPARPLEVGTRLTYYNHERMQEVEAVVRSAGLYMLWIIDVQESEARDHYISYTDIVQVYNAS